MENSDPREKGFKDRDGLRKYLKGILQMKLCGGLQLSKWYSKGYLFCYFLHNYSEKYMLLGHVADEETGSGRVSHQPKVTQVGNGKAGLT